MKNIFSPAHTANASDTVERVGQQADEALKATREAANSAIDTLRAGLDSARETAPSMLARAVTDAEDMTRRGIERARQASATVRTQAVRAGEQTVGYVKDEPVKAVLVAAAAGAVLAFAASWLVRSRRD